LPISAGASGFIATTTPDGVQLLVAQCAENTDLPRPINPNVVGETPAALWTFYIQLTEIEQAFKELEGDLAIRPVHRQKEKRIESHILVAFPAYCLPVTLRNRLRVLGPGLTLRAALDKFPAIQMLDVHLTATNGRNHRLKSVGLAPSRRPPSVAPAFDASFQMIQ
jgi:hypothetical protein